MLSYEFSKFFRTAILHMQKVVSVLPVCLQIFHMFFLFYD